MKNIYTIFFLILFTKIWAQSSDILYYAGTFYNEKNNPEKNLKVTNKTSGNYEFTDEKGFLIIPAKVGDTLTWNKKHTKIIYTYEAHKISNILANNRKYQSVNDDLELLKIESFYKNQQSKNDSIDFSTTKTRAKKKINENYYDYRAYRKILQKNDSLFFLQKQKETFFKIAGSFVMGLEIGTYNSLPKLQNQFVQGRNEKGSWVWKSPETGEMFSFGPDISTLAFDGNPYQYDQNGRLVAYQNHLQPAKIYQNQIFQKSVKTTNLLTLTSAFTFHDKSLFNFKLDVGNTKENSIFRDNFTVNNHFNSSIFRNFGNHKLSLGYKYNEEKATNSNRIGFFNRVYQNALLTPISFSNEQGFLLQNNQRSYGNLADNPYFLLSNPYNFNYYDKQNTYFINFERLYRNFKYYLFQTWENSEISNNDFYQKYSAGFFDGIHTLRTQKNASYNFNIGFIYSFGRNYSRNNNLIFNVLINNVKSKINYTHFENYDYGRFSQDYVLKYNHNFRDGDFGFLIDTGNSVYVSNTANRENLWLPKLNLTLSFDNIFDWYDHNLKFFGFYNENASETPINKSFANFASTQITPNQLTSYFPVREVSGFQNLTPIHNIERKLGMNYTFRSNRLNFEAFYFNKTIENDIFPVFENNNLMLKNLVNHSNKGVELNLQLNNFPIRNSAEFSNSHKISFVKYTSKVNSVEKGYNFLPISGFSNIYRGIVVGESLGAIVGTAFQRNTKGEMIIGNDGFPLVEPNLKVIGNPIPDFVMKFSHNLKFQNFSLDLNWEWKKGGDVWNGTSANLDYYGRSLASAEQRNITDYVFAGTLQNGQTNQIPVSFYDANKDFSENYFVRYGSTNVAEKYVVKGDYIRINSVVLSYSLRKIKVFNDVKFSAMMNNFLLWSKVKGLDSSTNFYNSDNVQGLDFYNLPSVKTYGVEISVKF